MSGIVLERRRLLENQGGGGGSEIPPTPVVHVFPSIGNTLTISGSGRSSMGRSQFTPSSGESVTVPNYQYNSWTDPTTDQLVDMSAYNTIYSTRNSASGNMVWCYVYCPETVGATITAEVTYVLSSGSNVNTLTATTTSNSFVSLSIGNSFASMSPVQSPNYGHPYLDVTNLTSINVKVTATKNGLTSIRKDFTIYIQNTTISLSAPTFSPSGGVHPSPVPVTITGDPNYSNHAGFSTTYLVSQVAEIPTLESSPDVSGQTVTIGSTCYLNAKSFLNLGNGTVIESGTTSQLYTISNPSSILLPPTFTPAPGNFISQTTVYINNPNSNASATYERRYTTDGSEPTESSNLYSYPIEITETTTFKAIVVLTSVTPHEISSVSTATYTRYGISQLNNVTYNVNSDTPSTCGDYSISSSQVTGDPSMSYGFRINASNSNSVVYFTTDGTEPTTSSQSISQGTWYYITRPNTTLVKYLVVAQNCADVTGQLWILVNKASVKFQYSGSPILLGPVGILNWYSETYSNYNENSSCYIYHNGDLLDPDDLSVQQVQVTVNGVAETLRFLTYTPPAGTLIDSSLTFIYAYSSPVKNWNGMCPYSPFYLLNGLNGTSQQLLNASNTVLNSFTGPFYISFSSNEIDTLCCSWMKSLYRVNFGGEAGHVSSCSIKPQLDYRAFTGTSLTEIDLTPCTGMVTIEEGALSGTIYESQNSIKTGLTSILMPMRLSYLGDFIFSKLNSSDERRPLTVTFYSANVPSASYNTFREFNSSSSLIGNTSTVIVNETYYLANVCDYEYAWHYHTPRAGTGTGTPKNKTDMVIMNQDGLQCGEYPPGSIPTVSTGTPGTPTTSSVTITGNSITSTGGYEITQKGICYSTAHSPVYSNNTIYNTETATTWNTQISGLQPETTYYVRAFARNESGIGYGEEKSFTTGVSASIPVLSRGHLNGSEYSSYFGNNYYRTGSKLVSNGGSAITDRKLFVKWHSDAQGALVDKPSPTNSDWSVGINGQTWQEEGTEYFEFYFDYTSQNVPSSGILSFSAYARNSIGWSQEYLMDTATYNIGGPVYPTISLSNPLFSEDELISGSGIYTYVLANANVTCGSYGDVVVETWVATSSGEFPGGPTVVGTSCTNWYDSSTGVTQESINTNGSNYCVYVTPCNIQTNTTYYLRSRVRQSQNSHWVYSNSVAFQRSNAQAGNFDIISIVPSSRSVEISAYGTVTPSKPYYGILIADSSVSVPTVNNCIDSTYGVLNGNSQDITYTKSFNGLLDSTQYKCRAFLCGSDTGPYDPNANIVYSIVSTFMTPAPIGAFTVRNGGNQRTATRFGDRFNLSFEAAVGIYWIAWTCYGWGVKDTFSTYEEHFDNEWECIGDSNGNIDGNRYHKRDLFGWGTSSQPHRDEDYDAWSTDDTNTYNSYDLQSNNLTGAQGGYANWGWQKYRSGNEGVFTSIDSVRDGLSIVNRGSVNLDLLNGDGSTPWCDQTVADYSRVLTKDEMIYLLDSRNTVSGARFCKGRISLSGGEYANGLILIPDAFTGYTFTNTNNRSAPFTSNTISQSDWASMHNAGVRFLRAAGYRKKNTVYNVNTEGWYWLNDTFNSTSNDAWCLKFSNSDVTITHKPKYYGMSVRLFCCD